MRFDWNDLRFFAAVLEHGSTAKAAKVVGVDQTTCARRISALEQALGLALFERDSGGYRPTPAALALQPAAAAVAQQVEQFTHQVETVARRATRRIRITCEEYLTRAVLAPALARFGATHPDVQIEIDSSSEQRDLTAGEADVAIRAGTSPPDEPSLIRRKLREDAFGIYCTDAYAARHGMPAQLSDLADHRLVLHESGLPGARAAGVEGAVRQVLTSMAAVQAAILTGTCVGPLPTIIAASSPELRCCFPLAEVSAIWLLYPERLRGAPEVRALSDLIAEAFRRT